jgi:small-conductance mechanosensitive channel
MSVNRTAIHGLLLWIIAVCVIIAGYYLSIEQFLDQHWLSRAGCFIVVLGIWSGLGGVIEEKLIHRGLMIKRHMALRRVYRAFGADEDEREKQLQKVKDKFDEQFQEIRNRLGISVGVIEASLLITGTLLWGFGDLVKYL